MRLGVVYEPCANAFYRAIDPMRAMERRGHHVVWPASNGVSDLRTLLTCDMVHIYRRASDDLYKVVADLVRRGVPITYDNDDDFTTFPEESPDYKKVGGAIGQRIFKLTVRMATLAHTFTTTSPVLAESYRSAGVANVEVIGNFLAGDAVRPRVRHEGVVIGWIAGIDHAADLVRIPIVEALTRVVAMHKDVRVESIGLDLGLPERYRHGGLVAFDQLPQRIGGYDIGLAPLADIPFNRARSDIKLKEYAASAVPWLASPVGPYRGLGRAQGGELVEDGGWLEALDRLVSKPLRRLWLARNAKRWAKRQTIDAAAEHWEQVFQVAAAQRSVSAPPPQPGRSAPGTAARP